MFEEITHCGFSDESAHGKYESIGLVTFPSQYLDNLQLVFTSICDKHGFHDLKKVKWQKLKSTEVRNCIIDLMDLTIKCASMNKIRVDVLIWDNHDSRHNIQRRDDAKNLAIMYYHLLIDMLIKRWPEGSVWELFPDRNNEINWDTLLEILQSKGLVTTLDLDQDGNITINLLEKYKINIIPSTTTVNPLIQLADIFAGMASYSRENFEKWKEWGLKNQSRLVKIEDEIELTRRDKERCRVIDAFNNACKEKKLGVSLNKSKGFKTYQPSNPINFWLYTPQHEEDTAPTH